MWLEFFPSPPSSIIRPCKSPPSILQPPSCRLAQQIWSLFRSALRNPKKKISWYKTNTQSESRLSKVKPYALLFLFHHNCNFLYHNSSAPCHLSLGHFAVLFHLPADLSGLLGLSLLFPLFPPSDPFRALLAVRCSFVSLATTDTVNLRQLWIYCLFGISRCFHDSTVALVCLI